jgi:hypothetical protein
MATRLTLNTVAELVEGRTGADPGRRSHSNLICVHPF